MLEVGEYRCSPSPLLLIKLIISYYTTIPLSSPDSPFASPFLVALYLDQLPAGELVDTLEAARIKAAGICFDLAEHFRFHRNFQEVGECLRSTSM